MSYNLKKLINACDAKPNQASLAWIDKLNKTYAKMSEVYQEIRTRWTCPSSDGKNDFFLGEPGSAGDEYYVDATPPLVSRCPTGCCPSPNEGNFPWGCKEASNRHG